MRRTFQFYQYINVGLLLFFGYVYWTLDFSSIEFRLLVGTSGVLLLSLFTTFYHERPFWRVVTYFVFFIAFLPTIQIIDILPFSLGTGALLIIGVLFAIFVQPPVSFLSGIIYGFSLILFVSAFLSDLGIEGISYYPLILGITYQFWIVILLFGYAISVLPYYIGKQKAYDNNRFYAIVGFILFVLLLPVILLAGAVIGIYYGIRNIYTEFRIHVRGQTDLEASGNDQPGFEVYWMKKAFRDWSNLRTAVVDDSKQVQQTFSWRAKNFKFTYGLALGFIPLAALVVIGYTVRIVGLVLLLVEQLLHLIVIAVIWIFTMLYYLAFFLGDKIYLRKNRVKTVCPSCYHTSILPNYVCSCGHVHTNLQPGLYGIRKRTCLCGEKLPTTKLDGRHELKAVCKNDECRKQLETKEATPFCISLVGGPSSGKTSFAISAIEQITEKVAPNNGWETEFVQSGDEQFFRSHFKALKGGQFPHKTAEKRPFAINLRLLCEKWNNAKLLYMYDPAGEAYRSSSELDQHDYLHYVDGYVLVIDPFSLPEVAATYEERLDSVSPSDTMLEDTYDMLLVHLTRNLGIKESKKITVPLAVVIHKVDAFQLEDEIAAAEINMENMKNNSEREMWNEKCKAFLQSVGYQSFVNRLESKFGHVQFFPSSVKSNNSFQSSDPIMWLMEKNK